MNNAIKTIFKTDITNDPTAIKLFGLLLDHGFLPIADIARELGLSVPTTTKILRSMKEEGLLESDANSKEVGTRNAIHYKINSNLGYFIGVDVKYNRITITLTDFDVKALHSTTTYGYTLWGNPNALTELYVHIKQFIDGLNIDKSHILTICVSIPGRVNTAKGESFTVFNTKPKPLAETMSEELGYDVRIDNDTRCMAYGEYILGLGRSARNVIFANIGWGIGTGIIINREIYYGKSGFSGEYGHTPAFDNEEICICGKKGCLETEVSGAAILRKFRNELRSGRGSILSSQFSNVNDIKLQDILDAAAESDNLAIEVIQNVGYLLGKHLAGLLNLFNPDVLILGGSIGRSGDYLTLSVKNSLMKYALNYVASDSQIIVASLNDNEASTLGACLLCRDQLLGVISPAGKE
jgi:predicted NBD/HSP70 family sugar kinase